MDYLRMGHRPKLTKPILLAAWPGVSNVALDVAFYLCNKLEAKEFADIDPVEFFTPVGILVSDNVVQAPMFPENKFYLIKTPRNKNDIIIFTAEAQPDRSHYDLAHSILDIAQEFGVTRIYTIAAALVQHGVENSPVWAAATRPELIDELKNYDITFTGEFQIRGLNGLLLGTAKERDMEAICLLGETPQYAADLPNPIAAYAVLKVLTKMLKLEVNLTDIAQESLRMAEAVKVLSKEAMTKYINDFTKPIWERNPRPENEETE